MLKIYNLVEARRHLRTLVLSAQNREKLFQAANSKHDVAETKTSMGRWSAALQDAQNDLENINSILIALQTELCDESNTYMVRLRDNAQALKLKIARQLALLEDRLAALTTKYESKLQVLLIDLERRFKRNYHTKFLVRKTQDREIGVLSLSRQHDAKFVFCVIMSDPMDLTKDAEIRAIGRNQYKLFFNAIPPDIALENFKPFLSPSKVSQDIMKTLKEEGF